MQSIFSKGLLVGFDPDPEDQHLTIYESLLRHRPSSVPDWVNPMQCIFAYINKNRYGLQTPITDGSVNGIALGIRADSMLQDRSWMGITKFSDWVYCPREAGYFDTAERQTFFRQVLEPACTGVYWKTSMSFKENLSIRHDHILYTQGHCEVLVCTNVPSSHLSLEALRIKGKEGMRESNEERTPPGFLPR